MNWRSFFAFGTFCLVAFPLSASRDSLVTKACKERWSVNIFGGYGFSASKNVLGSSTINDGQNNVTQNLVRGTFGKGVFSTLVCGYRVHNNLHIDLGGFVNMGGEIKTNHQASTAFPAQYQETYQKVNCQGAILGVRLNDTIGNIEIGLSNSVMCGIGNKGFERIEQVWPNNVYVQHWEYSERLSFGWLGNVSIAYIINNHFSLGINGFIALHSWSPGKGELVEYTYNDQDNLSTVPTEQRTIIYSDQMTYSSIGPPPAGRGFSFSYPLHIAGTAVSFRYSF